MAPDRRGGGGALNLLLRSGQLLNSLELPFSRSVEGTKTVCGVGVGNIIISETPYSLTQVSINRNIHCCYLCGPKQVMYPEPQFPHL